MRTILAFWVILLVSFNAYCQSSNGLSTTDAALSSVNVSESKREDVINGIIKNPELYNELWKDYIDAYLKSEWALLKNLDIKFKTFQTEENPVASLGLAYDFNFDYAKFSDSKLGHRISHTIGISTKGNIAFNRRVNPIDFLESKASYNFTEFVGGVKETSDEAIKTEVNNIASQLASMDNPESDDAKKLWEKLGESVVLSNQYYYSASPKFSLESNQNFSKVQFAPGVTIGLGAKAWNDNSKLAKFNLLDYPFALLRLIVGTDKKWTPYGATLPTVQIGFDYIKPIDDTTRERLVGNKKLFPRIKFETGFRTYITRIKEENIFFNANYRYYTELNSSDTIEKAGLASQNYFVMALQSTSGLYASYAYGKLPFDARNDKIYSIGFSYKLQ